MMERDFLGIHGRDSAFKEDTMGSRQDAAPSGGSAIQWPFSNKVSAMQQFMFYKTAQEEKPRNNVFDKHSYSRFHPMSAVGAFEANQKASHALAAQKCFGLDRQGINQYPMHAYPPQSTVSFDASCCMIPVNMGNPFFKVQSAHTGPNMAGFSPKQQLLGGGIAVNTPVVGSFAPRNMPKPTHTTAQLTIFYGGCVNVFDDVPFDKAQAIMSLASKGPNVTSNAMNPISEAPLTVAASVPSKVAGSDGISTKQTLISTPICGSSPCSVRSSPISLAPHTGATAGGGSTTNDDTTGPKAVVPLIPSSRQQTSKTSTAALGSRTMATNMSRAVPQARKASLARFLEKRKERMTNIMPYSCSKITPENGSAFKSCNLSSLSSSADMNFSGYREEPWFMVHPKGSIDSMEALSTKLAI